MNEKTYDALVIGGGPAGLAAATALARSRRDVAVVDAGEPRNAPAEGAHNVLGMDGIPPRELLAMARDQLTPYGARVVDGRVVGARRRATGFEVDLEDGTSLAARRVIVTSGVVDLLPDVPGLREHWGKEVVHCPYCHGWEVRGRRLGVIGSSPLSVHQALLFSQLSDDVTLVTHDATLEADERAQLASRGVVVVEGSVAEVTTDEGRLTGLRLTDGRELSFQALVVASRVEAQNPALTALGVAVEEHPSGMGTHVPVDEMGRTAVLGVYAAGNLTDPAAQVMSSAAAGTRVGALVNMDLITGDMQERMAG